MWLIRVFDNQIVIQALKIISRKYSRFKTARTRNAQNRDITWETGVRGARWPGYLCCKYILKQSLTGCLALGIGCLRYFVLQKKCKIDYLVAIR